jgi:hypothetical protein
MHVAHMAVDAVVGHPEDAQHHEADQPGFDAVLAELEAAGRGMVRARSR